MPDQSDQRTRTGLGVIAQWQLLPYCFVSCHTDVSDTFVCSCRVNPAADAVAALEHHDVDAVALQDGGSPEARDPRPDNNDLLLLRYWVAGLHRRRLPAGGQPIGDWEYVLAQPGVNT